MREFESDATRATAGISAGSCERCGHGDLRLSGFEDIDGPLDHAARVADHVDIGFVGTLGLAHIGHFNQRIYVRIFDVAIAVRGWMSRLVSERSSSLRKVGILRR